MNDILSFIGKKIVVVGASSGIGKQTAIKLAEFGADTILLARREELLRKISCEIKDMKGSHSYYAFDVCNASMIEEVVKKIVNENGKIDGLVYAAGVNTSMPLNSFKPEKILEVFSINYFGFIEFVRQICRRGRYNEGMSVVGISSVASVRGDKSHLAYSGSKAAMNASVRCIAKEVADKKIRINTVAPAMTRTDMYTKYTEEYGNESGSSDDILKRQYLGLIETEDVANAILFLLSPESRMLTGITLPVDGGLTTN